MKQLLFSFVIILSIIDSKAQTSEWTWIGGDSISNVNSSYGVKGIAALGNKPGGKDYASTWIDQAGNLWLFGGQGLASTGGSGNLLNDLWKYNIAAKEWTFVGGDTVVNMNGMYGTRGVPSATNKPGARYQCGSTTDKAGNFWLFGGNGFAAHGNNNDLNDLWKYSPSTGEWTWVSGDSIVNANGLYGTKGVPTATTKPVNRNAMLMWADNTGNIWIYAGNHASNNGYLSDFWKYDVTADQWTWMGGDSVPNVTNSVYGTKGTPAPGNHPGSRYPGVSFTDAGGNLWLFGGQGFDSKGNVGNMNDLWEYTISTNEWAWISGDTTTNNIGIFGMRHVPAPGNLPAGRQAPVGWKDNDGNFWVFGGLGTDAATNFGGFDDLWKYTVTTGEWTWMAGDSLVNHDGVYGTLDVTAPTNNPGARWNLTGWVDKPGNLWLFGGFGRAASGTGNNDLNDLWSFNAADSIVLPVAQFTVSDTVICAGTAVTFTDQSTGSPKSWFWSFTGGTPDTSSVQNPTVTYNQPGTYPVKLIVSNTAGADSLIKNAYITVNPLPVAGGITGPVVACAGSSVQLSDTGSSGSLQWQYSSDGTSFSTTAGDTTSTNNVTAIPDSAYYRVMATNACGTDSSMVYRLQVDSVPAPVAIATDTIICSGDSTQVCTSTAYTSYLWSTSDTTHCISATAAGGYWLTVTDANHCSAVSNHAQVSVYPVPSVSITVQGDTLSSFGQANYRWIKDGVPIDTATGAVYVAHQSGDYAVQVTDTNGCTTTSEAVTVTGLQDITVGEGVSVYPNPNSVGSWQLVVSNELANAKLEVYDEEGRLVYNSAISNQKSAIQLDVPSGVYYLRITTGSVSVMRKLVKM